MTIDQGDPFPPAHGRVTSAPGTIDCTESSPASACLGLFPQGTIVTLTATASQPSHFVSWSGCDSTAHDASGDHCTVHIGSARFVTAHFSNL